MSSEQRFDPGAIGSDIPRSRKQYLERTVARLLVKALRLNAPGSMTTEIVQAVNPIARIRTDHGELLCRCGHGRLFWLARTFHEEEPETIAWLDSLETTDVLWDIGSYVGLFSIYAAKFRRCRVVSIEPESQNFALLMENIALNDVEDRCYPGCFAITDHFGMGRLRVRYITKGGAYNWFRAADEGAIPASIEAVGSANGKQPFEQLAFGVSLDELSFQFGLPPPTHLKIDVDGLEPEVIDGASELLNLKSLQTILIEINKSSDRDMRIPQILEDHGFKRVTERSNWLSRGDRSREHLIPATNMIFSRERAS